MKRAIILIPFILFASEPSAFEAGNLDAPNPYGLTSTEKHILKNKEDIAALKRRLYQVESRLSQVEEKVEGLQSVVEGIDESLRNLRGENNKKDVQEAIAQLRDDLNASLKVQKENFASIKRVLKELTSLIDTINANYVSRKEFQRELSKLYAALGQSDLSAKSGAELFKLARRAYKKRNYQKAIEYYEATAKKGYKPATSNFYIGESCYYTKDYGCAVEHYKKSASLYSKASYMPTLLLHTAISLERLGKKDEAKKFYESVIQLYPKSKAASIAKKYIKKLK